MKEADLHLWGISDRAVEKAIIDEAIRRERGRRIVQCVWLALAAMPVMGVYLVLVNLLLPGRPWRLILDLIVPITVLNLLMIRWRMRHLLKHVPDVLREQGRCQQCGYQLTSETQPRCPECGHEGE